jgi:hypothetical protein
MLYYNTINSLENFYIFLKESFENSNYIIVKYQSDINKRLLIVKSTTANFTIAFNSLINTSSNIYNIEIQVFKSYDDNKSIHEQLNSIPKYQFKDYNLTYYPPQICINNTETDNCKTYLKIKENYFIIIYDAKADNSWSQGIYVGEYTSFSDNVNLIAMTSNNSSNFITSVENTPATNYLSNQITTSPPWLGVKQAGGGSSQSWLLKDNGKWDLLHTNNVNLSYYNFENYSNIFPINVSNKKFYNYLDNDKLELQEIYILAKKYNIVNDDYSKINYGYLNDIYLLKYYKNLNSEDTVFINNEEYLAFKYVNAALTESHNGIFLLKKY